MEPFTVTILPFCVSLSLEGNRATGFQAPQEGGVTCKKESDLSAHRAPLIRSYRVTRPLLRVPEPWRG